MDTQTLNKLTGNPVLATIYDELMQELEPDLTLAMLMHLDEMREGETEWERKERFMHYADSLEKCFGYMNELLDDSQKKLEELQSAFIQKVKTETERSDSAAMNTILTSISQS